MNQQKVISSLIFKFTERVAAKCLGLVIGVILARLLSPDDFGLVAIVTVFMNLATTFVQSGWSSALVQNKTTEDDDYSTVLWLSMASAVVLITLMYVVAPWIAVWYEESKLIWPLRIMSLSLLLGAVNSIQNARMQRNMQFHKMMYCNLTATVLSGTIGVISAFLGAGLWALVIYNVSYTALVCICMLVVDRWRPKWVFNLKRAGVFWKFGWKMLVSGLLCSIYNDIRSLVIGIRFSTADLAYYNRGQQFPEIIAVTAYTSEQSVLLPVMSADQDNMERLNKLLLKAISLSMFVLCPVMLGLAAVSQTLIPFLLTEKWMASVPLMIVLCVAYMFVPLTTPNATVLLAIGRSDLYMKLEVFRRIIMLAILAISVLGFHSVMAIAVGCVISNIVDAAIIIAAVRKTTKVGFRKQFLAFWKSLLASVIMAAVVFMMNQLTLGNFWVLVLQVCTGVVAFVVLSVVLRNEALSDCWSICKKIMKR